MADIKTRTRTWVKIVLAISLALNLAVVGMLGGAALRGHTGPPIRTENVSSLARAMPFKYQGRLRAAMRERRDEFKSERKAMRALRENLVFALEAQPFDMSAVEAVFTEQRELLGHIVIAGHAEVIAQIATMDAQDRARYVENLQKPSRYTPPGRP